MIREIGYTSAETGFSCDTCAVVTAIERQSPDISQGVTEGEGLHKEQGAGDQGLMFGYACDETKEYMPFAIYTSHRIGQRLAEARRSGELPYLLPDGKCQVTVEYRGRKARTARSTIVVSTQHTADVAYDKLQREIIEDVVKRVIPAEFLDKHTVYHINPTGKFVVGGPQGDCGLTGRKIIVDTYGGYGPPRRRRVLGQGPVEGRPERRLHGALHREERRRGRARRPAARCSSPTRSASPSPSRCWSTRSAPATPTTTKISKAVRDLFDLKPAGIIKTLALKKPIYQRTASYGHFGRAPDGDYFTWERTDRVA